MNLETRERTLESIADAKREIIRTEANNFNRLILDEAFQGLVMAEQSIVELVRPKPD